MTPLRYIVEPERLLMTWMPSDESGHLRLRRRVAEIVADVENPKIWHFRYLSGTPEMEDAKSLGFLGHPAFKLNVEHHHQGVRETLLRRLPSRSREDFAEFLTMHRLPNPFVGSDLALLGYTGAKLPSDGFAFVPVFPREALPCEYIIEVAGVRHVYKGDLGEIKVGDQVTFERELSNEFDQNAVRVMANDQQLGYVNRALLPSFNTWLEQGAVAGVIERKNGAPGRPLVYVRVAAGCPTEAA